MSEKRVVALVGPTGVGKTDLSVALAEKINAEIISCDSMQIYKNMDIGTAKVTKSEMKSVPHYMIDIKNPNEKYSVCDYVFDAKIEAEKIFKKNKIVMLVGGTGMYADSFVKDINFTEANSDETIREELMIFEKENGVDSLHKILEQCDKESAAAIHKNNVKRVIRAIEYFRITGEKISEHNKAEREKSSPYKYCYIGLTRDREELYDRIEKRVDVMMEMGLTDEVMALWKQGIRKNYTSMQALGYKEIINYIEGKCTLEETVRILKRDSRHYAKRQLTWFSRNKEINWINLTGEKSKEDVLDKILEILCKNGVIK